MAAAKRSTKPETKKLYQKTKKYDELKSSLIEQLTHAGNDVPFYLDMVDTYMTMWVTTQNLREDIYKRGVSVPYDNGGGQQGFKKNESIELLNKTNAQMLKLLAELKIQPSNLASGNNNDDL